MRSQFDDQKEIPLRPRSLSAWLQENEQLQGSKLAVSEATEDLITAAALGHNQRVREALQAGALIDGDQNGWISPLGSTPRSPLLGAVLYRHESTVNLLLDKGASLDVDLAALGDPNPTEDVVWMLPRVLRGLLGGSNGILQRLLQAGLDVNQHSRDGRTFLHHAIELCVGPEETVRISRALLDAGADFSLKDERGRTAEDLSEVYLQLTPAAASFQWGLCRRNATAVAPILRAVRERIILQRCGEPENENENADEPTGGVIGGRTRPGRQRTL
jgi:hypothetical protein